MKKALFAVAASLALASGAITKEEWEADHSLIPTPSSSSAFYVVEPTGRTGEQTLVAVTTGFDTTPSERTWLFPFGVDLITSPLGFFLIFR